MPIELRGALAFLLAGGAALLLLPTAIRVAVRTGFFDWPEGFKRHASPTPYLGGCAVLGAFLVGATPTVRDLDHFAPLLAGALVLCVVGTIDDRRTLRPSHRITVEAAVAAMLWAFGLGWSVFASDIANLGLTVLWTVGVINAFNLMDNMDGAAASCAIASSLGIAALAGVLGRADVAIMAVALTGACVSFLPFNLRSPARIFLGDGGSIPIGLILAGLAMAARAPADEPAWTAGVAAVLLVALPLTDTTLVAISRRRRGLSVFTGGHDHITYRLLRRLGSVRLVALALAVSQGALAAMVIVALELGAAPVVWVLVTSLLLAGATIVVMESEPLSVAAGSERGAATRLQATLRPRVRETSWRAGLVGVIGFACGASPLLAGFYSFSVWGPIALGALALAFGLFVAGELRPGGTGAIALLGLVGVACASLISLLWAESADRALVEADRWILYAAVFAVLLVVARSANLVRAGMAAATAGILVVAAYVLVRMLGGHAASLFLGGRLNKPLGYVNSQGLFLVLGIWPLLALGQYARRPWVAGSGAALATGLAGLAFLSQSRSVALAFVVAAAVAVALVPGRHARVWLLLAMVIGVGVISSQLIDVYQAGRVGSSRLDHEARTAAALIIAAAAGVGVVWTLVVVSVRRLPFRPLKPISSTLLAALALAVAGLGAAHAGRIAHRVGTEAKAFTSLHGSVARTRFLSGAGYRYDYWRVAAREYTAHPLTGVGAGNYTRDYFVQRRTTEDIRQPHSLELQLLSELGLLGAAAFALLIGAVVVGGVRRLRARPLQPLDRALLVASAGVLAAWLAHASVDWSHLLPGAVGVALLSAAYLVRPHRRPAPARPALAPGALVARGLVAVAVAVAAIAVGRPVLALHYRTQGEQLVSTDPVRALQKAQDSLSLNGEAVETLYLEAAAYARMDDYPKARRAMLTATRLEPHNFVPWALLGDLAVRRRDVGAARRAYRRAWRLNPRDPTLASLTQKPLP